MRNESINDDIITQHIELVKRILLYIVILKKKNCTAIIHLQYGVKTRLIRLSVSDGVNTSRIRLGANSPKSCTAV